MSFTEFKITRQSFFAALGLILLLGLCKHFADFNFFGINFGFLLVAAYQLYLPLVIIRKNKELPEDYGIWAHGFFAWLLRSFKLLIGKKASTERARFNYFGFKSDLRRTFLTCLITLPPYALLYGLFQSANAAKLGMVANFKLNISWELVSMALSNTFLVCLPEEVFYRGFLQNSLLKAMPNRFFAWGLPLGRAILITSAFFALGHFVGEYSLFRLTPFFPGLLFSMLAFRSGSIMGALLYHGICNTMSLVLHASYVWS